MSIRHIIIASVAAAGFSIAASAAPVLQQAPVVPGSQLALASDHQNHGKAADKAADKPAVKAPATHRHHRHRNSKDPFCPVAPWCWH
jgi:hypothetical protein